MARRSASCAWVTRSAPCSTTARTRTSRCRQAPSSRMAPWNAPGTAPVSTRAQARPWACPLSKQSRPTTSPSMATPSCSAADAMHRPRSDFPLLSARPGLVYLDSAATSQKPRAVLDAVREFYETSNANPHRGAYELAVAATERYQAARETVAHFL